MATRKAPPPKPERLSGDELAYHVKVVAMMRQARANLDHAAVVDAAWFAHLMERYHLTPDDVVDGEGAIRRGPAPPAGPTP